MSRRGFIQYLNKRLLVTSKQCLHGCFSCEQTKISLYNEGTKCNMWLFFSLLLPHDSKPEVQKYRSIMLKKEVLAAQLFYLAPDVIGCSRQSCHAINVWAAWSQPGFSDTCHWAIFSPTQPENTRVLAQKSLIRAAGEARRGGLDGGGGDVCVCLEGVCVSGWVKSVRVCIWTFIFFMGLWNLLLCVCLCVYSMCVHDGGTAAGTGTRKQEWFLLLGGL